MSEPEHERFQRSLVLQTRVRHLPIVCAVLVSACAAQTDVPDTTPVSGGPPLPATSSGSVADIPAAPGGYQLTAEEQKLDCQRLTGQLKVRAMNMRAAYAQPAGTATSSALQSVVTPVFGGTKRAATKEENLALDRAKLEAFNARLAEKKCKTADIDAELRGTAPAKATAPASKPAPKPTG